jgi:hypothetical protein
MIRRFAAAWLLVVSGLALSGCGTATYGTGVATAPYDFQANPYCGVYGTCAPVNSRAFRPAEFQATGF